MTTKRSCINCQHLLIDAKSLACGKKIWKHYAQQVATGKLKSRLGVAQECAFYKENK